MRRPLVFCGLAALAARTTADASRRVNIPQGAEFGGGPWLFTNIVGSSVDFSSTAAGALRGGAGADPAAAPARWRDPRTGAPVPVDANGWPLGDAATDVDGRPFPEWQCGSNPTSCVDDPWVWEQPMNGTYFWRLQGKATLSLAGSAGVLLNSSFDPAAFVTSGWFELPVGPALLTFAWTETQRNASAPAGSGFTDLRIMYPGHAGDADRTWAPELLAMAKVPDHLRFMGITGTNTQPGFFGDAGHHVLEWGDRCLPTDAQWPNNLRPGCWGMPWEDVVSLSQATGKGVWVNLPVSASCSLMPDGSANTSSYCYQWASLLKNGNAFTSNAGVPAGAPIYVEHSNEVWNYGFGQYIYNKLAAMDECNVTLHPPPEPPCLWNNDGINDPEWWARRRHVGRVHTLSRVFAAVFGEALVPSTVRPVLAEFQPWGIDIIYKNLIWGAEAFGDVSKWIYATSTPGYFGGEDAGANMTLDEIFAEYANSTVNGLADRKAMNALGDDFGIKIVAYEAGPGWSVGDLKNVQAFIVAQRKPQMRQIVVNDVAAWASAGSNMAAYNHFAMVGMPSRFGMWGHAENMWNQSTPKWCAVMDTTGAALTPHTQACSGW